MDLGQLWLSPSLLSPCEATPCAQSVFTCILSYKLGAGDAKGVGWVWRCSKAWHSIWCKLRKKKDMHNLGTYLLVTFFLEN